MLPFKSTSGLEVLGDEELLDLIARHHEAALQVVYERYRRLIYTVALRMISDCETAEEVVQDVFHTVWHAADSFQSDMGTFSAWLYGITRHRAIDLIRTKRECVRKRECRLDTDRRISDGSNLDNEITRRLMSDKVREAVCTLPTSQRQVIELTYYGEMSSTEVATTVGAPVGTVKTRLRLGLFKLRTLLQSYSDVGL